MNIEDPKTISLKTESPPPSNGPASAVAALRTIRVARGLSLEDAAARLKFAPRVIDALESERWDELPRGIGLRTLAKNYAKYLGADFAAIEPALREHFDASRPKIGLAEHTSTRSLGRAVEKSSSAGSAVWVVLIVVAVAVMLGIAVVQGIVSSSLIPDWLKGQ